MVGPSKILTVSYGTFSCTLEGFDDPFSTMRGIAEYFRDLAADDRYFGAEPPTPDAEMLHRIAEREVHRRVEARVENNGVVLRQMQDKTDAPSARPAATAAAAVQAVSDAEPEQEAEDAEPEASEFDASDFTGAGEAAVKEESVAEKLARLRAAVARREDDLGQDDEEEASAEDSFAPTGIAEAFEAAEAEPEPEALVEPEALETEFELADEDDADDVAAEADIHIGDDEPDDFVAEVSLAAAETIVEDEIADITDFGMSDEAEEKPEALEAEAIVLSDAEDAEDAFEDEVVSFADEELADEEAESPTEVAAETDDEDKDAPISLANEEFIDEEEAESLTEVASETDDEDEDETDAVLTTDEEAEVDSAMPTLILESSEVEEEAGDEEMQADEPAGDEPDAYAIARIVKMRRVDLEDEAEAETAIEDADEQLAVATGAFAQDQDDVEDVEDVDFSFLGSNEDTEVAAEDENSENVFGKADDAEEGDLSDEEEADLMATLAQVRRESEAESRSEKEGRAVLEHQDLDDNGNGVKRILDVTNTELEETEGSRRRSAIQHLRAAVLATRADKGLNRQAPTEERANPIDQYREDLAQVVRPRRPADGVKPTERRQAPLVLVSEQRIDTTEAEAEIDIDAGPVRPRRVTAMRPEGEEAGAQDEMIDAANDDTDENSGADVFADADAVAMFVEEMGATDLPDLVEALAAYVSYVEGQPHFSRPQMMRAIAAYCGEDFSREDSLRAFGQLLRNGEIQKLNRGQFAVSQSTRFNPGARAAGE